MRGFEPADVAFGILHCGSTMQNCVLHCYHQAETAEIPNFAFGFLVFIWGKFLPILVGSCCLFSLICCSQYELRLQRFRYQPLLQDITSVTTSQLIGHKFNNLLLILELLMYS